MPETVRRLTKKGISQFRSYLGALRDGGNDPPPMNMLTNPQASEAYEPSTMVEKREFPTRLELARYLAEVFGGTEGLEEDVGLWSWMSLFYFDQVCPPGPAGVRSPGRDYRHIPEPGYLSGHRHLLSGPYLVYRLHGEKARLLLATRIHQESFLHHELASRQALVTNTAILEAANNLYTDGRTGRVKRGAQDARRGPGTFRRFIDVVQQLDLNYDLYSMSGEALLRLLPKEFDEWKRKKRSWLRRRRSD